MANILKQMSEGSSYLVNIGITLILGLALMVGFGNNSTTGGTAVNGTITKIVTLVQDYIGYIGLGVLMMIGIFFLSQKLIKKQ